MERFWRLVPVLRGARLICGAQAFLTCWYMNRCEVHFCHFSHPQMCFPPAIRQVHRLPSGPLWHSKKDILKEVRHAWLPRSPEMCCVVCVCDVDDAGGQDGLRGQTSRSCINCGHCWEVNEDGEFGICTIIMWLAQCMQTMLRRLDRCMYKLSPSLQFLSVFKISLVV
jgi:hypothetical protein